MDVQTPRYWDAVEPVWDGINIYDGPDIFLDSFAKVPRPVGITYAAHFCLSEVHNGGWLQFFLNNTGVLAPEALEGFIAIGMPSLAAVTSEAMAVMGDPYPRDRQARADALLRASPLSNEQVDKIIRENENFYAAYVKVTEPLGFGSLNKRAWELSETENGDFGNAATRYFAKLGLLQRH